jgi:hypothetical protein
MDPLTSMVQVDHHHHLLLTCRTFTLLAHMVTIQDTREMPVSVTFTQ